MLAFKKARKDKTTKDYVIEFENNIEEEINKLQAELKNVTYKPNKLRKFIIRDPKTRTIHSSKFKDRVVHHSIVNVLELIYEQIFIFDSYASRLNKGTHKAVTRFDKFKRKVSENHQLIKNSITNNQIKGYFLKADIKKYFDNVDHEVLINILRRKIKDNKVLWLIKQILDNFETKIKGKGMPLGNLTSQFFANVYLNNLDYFVKHTLRVKNYIRYVDDFLILHENKKRLIRWKEKISGFLMKELKLELHEDKSKIKPLKNGITFLGYRIYGKYKLLRKSNLRKFQRECNQTLTSVGRGVITFSELLGKLNGWFGYAKHANTYALRKKILEKVQKRLEVFMTV